MTRLRVDSFSEPTLTHADSQRRRTEKAKPRSTSPAAVSDSSGSMASLTIKGRAPPAYPHTGGKSSGQRQRQGAQSPYAPQSAEGLRGFNFILRVSKAASRSLGCSIVGTQ